MSAFDYVFHYVDFANRTPGSLVGAVILTLQTPGGREPRQDLPVAGFSRGALSAGQVINYDGQLGGIDGVLQGRFSDRHDVWGTPMTGDTDDIGLQVLADARNRSLAIRLNLMRWGGAIQLLTPVEVADGILHATGPAVGNVAPSASYLISFSEGAPGLSWRQADGFGPTLHAG